jgi:glycosyltransferase involved in cell wall biosynthesis
MKNREKIIVIMPAYNAELTLEKTYKDIPKDVVDEWDMARIKKPVTMMP